MPWTRSMERRVMAAVDIRESTRCSAPAYTGTRLSARRFSTSDDNSSSRAAGATSVTPPSTPSGSSKQMHPGLGTPGGVEGRHHWSEVPISLLHRDCRSCGEVGVGEELPALLPMNEASGVELTPQVGVDRGYQRFVEQGEAVGNVCRRGRRRRIMPLVRRRRRPRSASGRRSRPPPSHSHDGPRSVPDRRRAIA